MRRFPNSKPLPDDPTRLLKSLDWPGLCRDRDLMAYLIPWAEEVYLRANHPSIVYKPDANPKRDQLSFHKSTAMIRLGQGGNQSGKSRMAAQEVFWWLNGSHPYMKTPPCPRIYVVSTHYRTIQEGVYRHLKNIIPAWKQLKSGPLIPKWDIASYLRYQHPKGEAQVDFLSTADGRDARKKCQAASVDLVVIDEEIPEEIFKELLMRLVARGGKMIITLTAVISDPWLLELEDRAISGDPEVFRVQLTTSAAVQAGHIDEHAYKQIIGQFSPEELAIRIDGESRRESGLIYKNFGRQHVVEPFEIPKNWTRYMAIDPGHQVCAVLYIACSPDEKLYIYRELYLRNIDHYYKVVCEICTAENWKLTAALDPARPPPFTRDRDTELIAGRFIDPSAYGHYETGDPKLGIILVGYGLPCIPAH